MVLAALWLAAVAVLTLTPQSTARLDPRVPQLSACLICGERGTSDAILNALLFLPLGLLLNDRGWRLLRVAGVGLALSGSIELVQHFIPGRYSNLGDVVWNTTGAWMGAVLWSMRARWLPAAPRDAAHRRNLAVLIAPVVTLAFGWLMEPDLPREPYWGQWMPDLGFMEQYRGKVIRARLDSIELPSWRLPDREHVRNILMQDWRIEATMIKGPPPTALAPIVNIYDGKPEEVTMLGALRQDLVYRERTRARRFRFDDPALWFPGALATAATGDTVQVGIVRLGRLRCLMFNESTSCPTFTPGRAWALLLPFQPWSGRQRRILDTAWILLLLFPVGFWSEGRTEAAVSAGVTGLLLVLAVGATRIALPHVAEVAGAALGLAVGHILRRALATDHEAPPGPITTVAMRNPPP